MMGFRRIGVGFVLTFGVYLARVGSAQIKVQMNLHAVARILNAAGRLTRTLSYYVDTRTHHDGDGNEIKRRTDTLNDDTGLWDAQPTKYYIRPQLAGGCRISH